MRAPVRLRGERAAAAVLLRSGPAAAALVLVVGVLAALLVPFGGWRPSVVVPLLLLSLPVVAAVVSRVPTDAMRVPVWAAVASVAVAVAFMVWAGSTHDEHVVLRRDSGSYALFAQWLATRHGLPVDAGLDAFGGPAALRVPGFTLESPAFYQVLTGTRADRGAVVVPQFLLGAPALLSLGWWTAGSTGLFVVPALLGGLAVLALAGLVARLVGPSWAPLAAGAFAVSQPLLHAARSTLSEPPATLLVVAAAALAADAVAPELGDRRRRLLAATAGGMCGLAGLVRIDALREVALVVVVATVLALRRHRAGLPLGVAALAGAVASAVPAYLLSRPYLHTVAGSLRPLVAGTAALTVASAAALAAAALWRWWRWWRQRAGGPPVARPGSGRWLRAAQVAAALGVVAVAAVLVSRPAWQVALQAEGDPGNPLVAGLQRQQGLAVDPMRTYAEQSVTWLLWYTGVPAALAAVAVLSVLAALAVGWWWRGDPHRPPVWLVPAWVGTASTILVLYRPGITPDHPWADRRLVPVALPLVVVAATGAAAWTFRRARRRWPATALASVAVVAVVALVGPPAVATRPLAASRTEVGEPGAVETVCRTLAPGDVVVALSDSTGGSRGQNEWVQVVRGVCGRPAAALNIGAPQNVDALRRLGRLAAGAGHRLVVLAAGEDDGTAERALADLGLQPRRAVLLRTTEDQRLLVRRPDGTVALLVDVWTAVWSPPPSG